VEPGRPDRPARSARLRAAATRAATAQPGTVFKLAVAAAAGVAVVYLALRGLWLVRSVLILVVIALFVAATLEPAVAWLERHKVRRGLAVALIAFLALGVVVAIIAITGPPLISQARSFASDLPQRLDEFTERSSTYRDLSARYGLDEEIQRIGSQLPGRIGSSVVGFFKALFGFIGASLLVFVLSCYFMADFPRMRRGLPKLFPKQHQARVRRISDVVIDKVSAYMLGNIVISLVAGVVTYVGLMIIGVPYALPLALFVAITDLLPLVGATIGAVVCVAVAIITGGIWPDGVLTLILFIVYQQLENYLIAPRVLKRAVDIPAVVVLLAGLIGATMLGLIGALMAIPIAAAIVGVINERHVEEESTLDVEPDSGPDGDGQTPAESGS
jgi:predicted PurR-regulated permease PerM